MLETISQVVVEALKGVLVMLISPILELVQMLLELFAKTGALRDLTHLSWVENLVTYGQAVAVSILILRLAWEAFQMMSLRAEGAPTDPGGLIKRTCMTATAIFAGPFVVRYLIIFGNKLALMVANAGFGVDPSTLDLALLFENALNIAKLASLTLATIGLFPLAVLIAVVVLMLLIFLQALIRTIEVTLGAIISPYMALGFMSGGGTADVWWREILVVTMAHAVQMLLVYMSLAFLVAPDLGSFDSSIRPFLFIAGLWVAFRTPRILRNYAYSSGTRSAVGTLGQAALWRTVSRLGG